MPLFVCDKCHAVENTACGRYWSKDTDIWKEEDRGQALCSECAPTTFKSGEPNSRAGKWHGRFEKKIMTPKRLKAMSEKDLEDHYIYIPEDLLALRESEKAK